MDHSFNIDVAKKIGIAPAVILNNLYWWIDKNEKNEANYHDGKYWTYNSRKAFCKQFPYMTERQIEYALRKLIDEGYVITGNYNKSAYDRTLWYAITKKGYSILQNCEMETTDFVNGNTNIVKPIPDNNTNTVTNNSLTTLEGAKPSQSIYKEIYGNEDYKPIIEALKTWDKYCKNVGRGYKRDTFRKWAKFLSDRSKGNPEIALAIVNQSIKKGWKDLFELKDGYKFNSVSIPFDGKTDNLADVAF